MNEFYDTRLIFDAYRNRFWIQCHARNMGPGHKPEEDKVHRADATAIAVSKTENPLDGWLGYWWSPARDYESIGISEKLLVIGYRPFKEHHDAAAVVNAEPLAAGSASPPQGYMLSDLKNPDGSSAEFLEPALQYGPSPMAAHFLVNTSGGDTLVVWAIDPDHPGDIYRAGVPVVSFVSPKLAEQASNGDIPHPRLIDPLSAGPIVLKSIFRNGKLHACWQDSKPLDTRQLRFIRLARVDVSSFPQAIPTSPESGLIDRRFGKNTISDPPGVICSYYLPTLAVNAAGTIVVNYCRCGPDVFPEARCSVYGRSDADIQPSQLVHKGEYPIGTQDPKWSLSIQERAETAAGTLDYIGIAPDPADDLTIWIINAFGNKKAQGEGQYNLVVKRIILFGKEPKIFFYSLNTRAGAVGHVTSEGKIAIDGQQGPGTFGTWTHIASVGNGRAFFYNQNDGSGAVGHVTPNGEIATDGQQGPGTFGKWTHIVDIGNGRAFFYNDSNRSGAVGHVTVEGTIVTDGQQGPGTFGKWTHIVDIGNGRAFFYNDNNRSGAVGHVTVEGTIATDGQQGPGTFGTWTHVVGFGDGRAIFYNKDNRSGAVGHVSPEGTIVTDGQQGPGTFGTWTHVVGFGVGQVFFYNKNDGSGAVGHITQDGKIATDGQQGQGTFGNWAIVSAL